MPRTRKTQTGERAQPVAPVAAQEYGMGVQQAALQRQMPAPQQTSTAPTALPPSAPPTVPVGAAAPERQAQPLDEARIAEIAQRMQGQMGLLTKPTARPHEPVTAGLPSGPGAGPEALQLRRGNMTGEMLRRLSIATGDPLLRALADRAGV